MRILIDTSVLIDVLQGREPHVAHSAALLRLCDAGLIGCITASQTTDIFYLLCRFGLSELQAKATIIKLKDHLQILDVTAKDVNAALDSAMEDYEDALLACCGRRVKADYLITRNIKDFATAPVPALTPEDFINKFFPAI